MSKKRSLIINTLIIIILLVLLALFYVARFGPLFRFWYSLKVFALDVANYFVVLFTGKNIEYLRLFEILKAAPDIDLPTIPLPEASDTFNLQFRTFFKLFINLDNFKVRMYGSLKILILLAQSIQIVIIVYLLLKLIFSNYFDYNDLSFNHKSKPLKVYQSLVKKVLMPIFNFLRDVVLTVRHRTFYYLSFIILLGLHLNLFAIVLDVFGFLFYLTSSFDFVSAYHFMFVLLLTLEPLVKYVPF
ncbi:MAG: hypothetical protein RBQ97_09830, partial [Acholeplasma sp.]|nr:hypothetical protein [Acholeplasma sp.]